MRFGFSYIGLIWLIMLFVPNMIWTKNKPQDYEKYVESENKVPVSDGETRAVYRNACVAHFFGF